MATNYPFTISGFYNFIKEKKLMCCVCNACGTKLLPPKPICTKCFSDDMKWTEIQGIGKLISYTIIHIAPKQFESMAPYIVGIIEFDENLRLPGMIRNIKSENMEIGMKLKIDFEKNISSDWPSWGKYFFRPIT